MPGVHDYGLFVAACVLLNLTPGQDTFYIIGRTLAQGRTAGIASALGINTGSLIHAVAAALGLATLVATSATAFVALQWLGAAYLIYLGVTFLMASSVAHPALSNQISSSAAAVFRQGVLTNLTNPKVAAFFLAFLPQFVDPGGASKMLAFFVLGLTFVVTGTLWCLILAMVAAHVRAILTPSSQSVLWLNRVTGVLFVSFGIYLAARIR